MLLGSDAQQLLWCYLCSSRSLATCHAITQFHRSLFILSCKTNGKVDVIQPLGHWCLLIVFAWVFAFSGYFTIGCTIMMNVTSWAKSPSPGFLCKLSDLGSPCVSEHYVPFHSTLKYLFPILMNQEWTRKHIKWEDMVLFQRGSELNIRKPQQPRAWGVAMAATLLSLS